MDEGSDLMCQHIKQADIQVHWWNEDFYSWRLKGAGYSLVVLEESWPPGVTYDTCLMQYIYIIG